MSPTDKTKCDLLGIRVMCYVGMFKDHINKPTYSVRKRTPMTSQTIDGYLEINNLCTHRADGTKEVAIFRSVESAIRGATSKENGFLK